MSYLQDFLFSPDRARSPVKVLSGGERNRALLARLFTKSANLLVMDEPTNDLDIETLELLEELLIDYSGTLLLVSHDRAFLDNVVTSSLVFEGNGHIGEYVGGYSDWLRQRPVQKPVSAARKAAPMAAKAPAAAQLSSNERRELRELPQQIERLEQQISKIQARMGEPGFYEGDPARVKQETARLNRAESELETAFERWEALEARGS
jgi:ATP-binding cassette subfamily F protein uup